jgi:hypothetical protein
VCVWVCGCVYVGVWMWVGVGVWVCMWVWVCVCVCGRITSFILFTHPFSAVWAGYGEGTIDVVEVPWSTLVIAALSLSVKVPGNHISTNTVCLYLVTSTLLYAFENPTR